MGAGKTTVGRILAKNLGLSFLDTDEEIEHRSGASVSWIFDIEGEAGFRDREEQLMKEITKRKDIVISTGGGVVLRQKNIARHSKTLENKGANTRERSPKITSKSNIQFRTQYT